MDRKRISAIVTNGQNMMPGFSYLEEGQVSAVVDFLLGRGVGANSSPGTLGNGKAQPNPDISEEPYTMTGYNRFIAKDGYPGIKPPWGTLNAVDLNSGKLLWKVPLGHFEALTGKVKGPTGTQVYGGPVVTAGGLVFVASTQDERIRAFDKRSGRELWSAKLPAAGYATPSVYEQDGRQYIVIACGGGKLGSPSGDSYVAFALPKGP
jgi:quinoprotein glucose dehydrogenase